LPFQPRVKRTVVFADGQNLYYSARLAFGRRYPDYDVVKLGRTICESRGWVLAETRFYTGVPDRADNPHWNHFWNAKLPQMGREGVVTFQRALRYRNQTLTLPDGSEHTLRVGQEKGIDIRIALDIVRLAHRRAYDVALVLSQDQDMSEAAIELRTIAREQARWLKIASAFPLGPTTRNRRGIDRTDWIPIDRATYEACLDPRDYRPKT
jgi:uncharacterized LabA/DUF88 family protein